MEMLISFAATRLFLLVTLIGFIISGDLERESAGQRDIQEEKFTEMGLEYSDLGPLPILFNIYSLRNRFDAFSLVKKNLTEGDERSLEMPYPLTCEMNHLIRTFGVKASPFLLDEMMLTDERHPYYREYLGILLTTLFYCIPKEFPPSGFPLSKVPSLEEKRRIINWFKGRLRVEKIWFFSAKGSLPFVFRKLALSDSNRDFLKIFFGHPFLFFQ